MVILLRHGATPENDAKPEILRGTNDSPLSERGRAEVQKAAEKICSYPVVEVHTDGYRRDTETAEIVSAACGGVPIVLAPELEPYNVGILSGQEKRKVWPLLQFLFAHPDVPAPGGEAVRTFVDEWTSYWWAMYAEYGGRDDVAVVPIVHGTEYRALKSILYGVPMPSDYEEHVKTGEFVVIH